MLRRLFGRRNSASTATRSSPSRPATMESLEGRSLMSATLYVADSQGALFKLNPANGTKSIVGRLPVIMFDIAFNKSGQLFGVDSRSNLYRINAATAAVTRIGAVGGFVNALTFAPDGKLLGAGNNRLYTINTATGRGTVFGTFPTNINSAGDLAFDGRGNLFFTTTADKLIKINLSSRTFTTVGSIGFRQVYGLAYLNGKLYGMSNATEQAFVINTTTGRGTLASNFGANVVGANGAAVKL